MNSVACDNVHFTEQNYIPFNSNGQSNSMNIRWHRTSKSLKYSQS